MHICNIIIIQVVKRDYNKDNASLGARQLVEFESNKITLNIPQEGITLDEGWKIMPQIAPVVRSDCYEIKTELRHYYFCI